ncbi:RidA family protein [Spartinivicinus marinus]|uniref:RidA family protein n=1 Tax=Spartinivicinus marinus TaxID=2994442 RepID=UPI002258E9DC|nr:RidA family protein [Spartinivicinus marinus]
MVGPYVHAVRHDKTLYVSGLTALGTDNQSKGIAEQTETVLSQLQTILEIEGCDSTNILKATLFLKSIDGLSTIRPMLVEFYGKHLPACSLVEVSSLIHPDLLVEIEAVVALS